MNTPKPIPYTNYLSQLRSASQWEKDFHANLIKEGWVWDDVLRQWTHPDKPGASISY